MIKFLIGQTAFYLFEYRRKKFSLLSEGPRGKGLCAVMKTSTVRRRKRKKKRKKGPNPLLHVISEVLQ